MKNRRDGVIYFLTIIIFIVILALAACSGPPATEDQPEEPAPAEAAEDPPEAETPPTVAVQTDPILSPEEAGIAENQDSIIALVNKNSHLTEDYIPADLEYVDIPFSFSERVEKRMLRHEAAVALAELVAAAKEAGLNIYGVSGYRSYNTQVSIFNYNVGRFGGEEAANRISARPGESEHQTGLVMDVSTAAVNYTLEQSFDQTPEYAFIRDNAHNYGFVVRYPNGKEDITGYMYEPWHLRYFGPELATVLYEAGQTYEEYLKDLQ
ncbi:MAG: M15 family metallopeptidase [Gracilibacteraceae bacterium]|jgi:D-alanyl-D-alanine carboxypeptidase|nr:M15 family metallopeptidase [Gracilibacteraceae bacterium]